METISIDVIKKATSFLRLHDYEFFIKETKLSDVSQAFRNQHSLKMKLSHLNVVMRITAKTACVCYRQKLKPIKHADDADPEYWENLKGVVETMMPYLAMEGVNLEVAERIVRLKISTNRVLLQGLPSRLRVWEAK